MPAAKIFCLAASSCRAVQSRKAENRLSSTAARAVQRHDRMTIAALLPSSGPANRIPFSSRPGLPPAATGSNSNSSRKAAFGDARRMAPADWEESRQALAGSSPAFHYLIRRSWHRRKNAAPVADGTPGGGGKTAVMPPTAAIFGWRGAGLRQFPIAAASSSQTEPVRPEVLTDRPLRPKFFAMLPMNAPAPVTAFSGQDVFVVNRPFAAGRTASEGAAAASCAFYAAAASVLSPVGPGVEPRPSHEKEPPGGKTGGTAEQGAPPAAGERTETAPLPAQAQPFAFAPKMFPSAAPVSAAPQAGVPVLENQPAAKTMSAQPVDSFPAVSLRSAFTLQAQRQEAPAAATGQVIRSEAAKLPSTASASAESSPARRPGVVLSPASRPDAGAGKHGQPEGQADAESSGVSEKPAVPQPPNSAVAKGAVLLRQTPAWAETGDQRAAKPEPGSGPEKILALHTTAIQVSGNNAAESGPIRDAQGREAANGPSVPAETAPGLNPAVERACVSSTPAGSRIDLLLRPEGLGRVAVRLVERGDRLEVAVRSESQPAKSLLAESLPSLVEGLRRQGWDITRAASGAESDQKGGSAGQQGRSGYDQNTRRQQAQGGTRKNREPAALFSLGTL